MTRVTILRIVHQDKVGTEVEILPALIQNLAQAHARMQGHGDGSAGVRRDAAGDQPLTLMQRQVPGESIVFDKEFLCPARGPFWQLPFKSGVEHTAVGARGPG